MCDVLTYRRCVVGVFINAEGHVLVGRRQDREAWQFPQGGIEPGESEEEALYREMTEEIGCSKFRILQKMPDVLSYDFPATLDRPIAKLYKGQTQWWFLCEFLPSYGPQLDQAVDEEFIETKWVIPVQAIDTVVGWKKSVYQTALTHFSLLSFP